MIDRSSTRGSVRTMSDVCALAEHAATSVQDAIARSSLRSAISAATYRWLTTRATSPQPANGLLAFAIAATWIVAQPSSGRAQVLPARFIADRIYAAPVTARGDTLLLYLDTGGGANMIYPRTLVRLGIRANSAKLVALPPLRAEASIPLPGPLLVVPPPSGIDGDGFLGRTWFADRVWRLDYLGHTLTLLNAPSPRTGDAHRVALGFQVDSAGRRTTHFARIRVAIDGDSLDLLFDTGATINLTDAGWAALRGDGEPRERGTSFIAQTVFERWRQRHPDWRVVEHADRVLDMPMILVPDVRVGGYAAGPAWFTMRPDKNFHQFMSQWMDRRVEGALGGSVLRSFRVTLDYPGATATFER